ncbi:hypothetical protein GCM10023264_06850 [Sphingomonas daechungensis]
MHMRMNRPVVAIDPRLFGKRIPGFLLGSADRAGFSVSDDVKLFASTFAVGFVFVSVLIF